MGEMVESAVSAKKGADGGDDGSMFADDPAGVNIGYSQIDGGAGVGYG